MLGRTKHAVDRCDEPDGSHTWDVWRHGTPVWSGFRTRAEARRVARQLDDEETCQV